MTNITARISAAAMLALAALPMAAIPASAFAETTVQVSDINVLTPEGVAAFNARVDAAAQDFCRAERDLGLREACKEGVKIELAEKLNDLRVAKLQGASALAAR